MLAIALRIIKQMKNNKRAIALMLFAPIIVLSFMYLIFSEPNYEPYIATVDMPAQVNAALEEQLSFVVQIKDEPDVILESRLYDAVLYTQDGKMTLKMYESDSTKTKKITKMVTTALQSLNSDVQGLEISFLYVDAEQSVFDSLGFAFLGIFSFMFVFLIVGISFIKERTLGTMERFMLAPVSRYSVVAGFILGFGFFAAIQSVLVVLYAKYVLRLSILGSFWAVILIMVLLSLVAVATGALVSLFADNEFRVVQFTLIAIVPQVFFSGIIPVDTLPYHLDKLAYFMPVYYACGALNEVMVKGAGFSELLFYYNGLLLFVLILFLMNVLLLKKYRKI